MQLENLNDIRDSYQHVVLSPHLDDAALSCGGRIGQLVARGERVLVVTLCTAAPPATGPFSELAQRFHADWGLAPDQVVASRLKEDRAAMERLGADFFWAGMLDAIYRYPEAYNSRDSLFNAPAPNDPLFADLRQFVGMLREKLPRAQFYAPLGVGSHVDHLITHAAISDLLGEHVLFYEDLHYALTPGALEQRLAAINMPFASSTIAIDTSLQTKISAIAAYASQLGELFGGEHAMVEGITAYAHSVKPENAEYGERVWRA